MKVISLFNHKGGVSKTTTAFNLGWMLAEKGYKTLLVDADPQCNLTALVLGYTSPDEDFEELYSTGASCDIYSNLEPVFNGSMKGISPSSPLSVSGNENLFLLCGSLSLSEQESQISVALTASIAIPAIKNIPGSITSAIRITAETHGYDYVIIDMSPSVGALNQCLLMGSDYFVVPTFPDFFCSQAISSLTSVIPRWNKQIDAFRGSDYNYPFPDDPPKFLGFISQKYRPRSGAPAKSFSRWIDVITGNVNSKLVPALYAINMVADGAGASGDLGPFNLANISDFNSLIAQSQKHNVPVFALSDAQIEQSGTVLVNMIESRDKFRVVFDSLAEKVIELAV